MFDSEESIEKLSDAITKLHNEHQPEHVLPSEVVVDQAREKLVQHLPSTGIGLQTTIKHIQEEIVPGFTASSRSPNYYGFVTGGSTPAATLADNIVTFYDQNVQVHLPKETMVTDLEDRALSLLCELLKFEPSQWPHKTFTTGATASNVLGLACGREFVLTEAAAVRTEEEMSVGEIGIFAAMHRAGIDKMQVLTTVPHSSLSKAASILGMGRAAVKTIGLAETPYRFDIPKLKKLLEAPGTASIVAISAAEVNTGLFATSGLDEMREIRKLCDMYGAWIHVDGAFGIMGRQLTSPDYTSIINACAGLELADSITGDGHKLLNVPYDCGFFLSRHREVATRVLHNPNAAYLGAGNSNDGIMSPLNIGLENSRRMRALPVYASLTAYGSEGYRDMLERQIGLARGIAEYLLSNNEFDVLPQFEGGNENTIDNIFIIVLFRAKEEGLNQVLVERIKATRRIYVSGTTWDGKPACRFAVSNWRADVTNDLPIIKDVLEQVVSDWKAKH